MRPARRLLQVALDLTLRLLPHLGGILAELASGLTPAQQVPRLIELSLQLGETLGVRRRRAGLAKLVLLVDQMADALVEVVVLAHASFSTERAVRSMDDPIHTARRRRSAKMGPCS